MAPVSIYRSTLLKYTVLDIFVDWSPLPLLSLSFFPPSLPSFFFLSLSFSFTLPYPSFSLTFKMHFFFSKFVTVTL